MKVQELIKILGRLDPSGDVYVLEQPGYPFEAAFAGVAVREDFTEPDDDEDDVHEPEARDRWSTASSKLPRNDVFLLVGQQLRYGDKAAWDVARRR